MVLYNAASRARNYGVTLTHNTMANKAGTPFNIGRNTQTSRDYRERAVVQPLRFWQMTPAWKWRVRQSRPTGGDINIPMR